MTYYYDDYYDDELYHHGIKGMKWGVRRFQRADGSRTAAGLKRYAGKAKAGVRGAGRKIKKFYKAHEKGIKTGAKIAAGAAAAAALGYGAYRLNKSGKLGNAGVYARQGLERASSGFHKARSKVTNTATYQQMKRGAGRAAGAAKGAYGKVTGSAGYKKIAGAASGAYGKASSAVGGAYKKLGKSAKGAYKKAYKSNAAVYGRQGLERVGSGFHKARSKVTNTATYQQMKRGAGRVSGAVGNYASKGYGAVRSAVGSVYKPKKKKSKRR